MRRQCSVVGIVHRRKIPRRTAKRVLFNVAAAMRAEGLEPLRRKGRLINPVSGETIAAINY